MGWWLGLQDGPSLGSSFPTCAGPTCGAALTWSRKLPPGMTDLHHVAVSRPSPTTVAPIREAPQTIRLDGDRFRIALALAVGLAVAIRGWHVLSQDFPLNDGGLFYAMARDIQAAGYRLPAYTSYNGDGIPFGYSPLGFYLAAFLDGATTVTLTDALRWIPLVASCLVVMVFAALARAILANRPAVVAAVLAFAVVPRSFLWLVMGGGLTRSLGLLFALTTLWLLLRLYVRRDWRLVPLAGGAAGLTLLSHLGTAPFAAFSAALLWLAYGRHRTGTLGTLAAAAIALVVSAPWWYTVLADHGSGPFLAAMATGGSIFQRVDLRLALTTLAASGLGTGEPVLGLVGMLAVVGFFFALTSRDWLLPAWWITIVALDARQGSTFSTVPVSMLAGVAIVHVLLPAMRRAWTVGGSASTLRRNPGRRGWSPAVVVGLFLLFGVGTALLRLPSLAGDLPNLKGLSAGEREAMEWVATETPDSSRVLVVGGTPWEIDRNSEWLPVLGRRRSVATVQGWEWKPAGAFAERKREYNDVQACAGWSTECLENWEQATGERFDYVYVPRRPGQQCCGQLRLSLERDPAYRLVYDGGGATIYEREWAPTTWAVAP